MRLHFLRISAFGPYAGTEAVDFDALNDAGIFLLHGPTGAGKTSILDAVCFAIFGSVPGARGPAARLRSDHADDNVRTEVVLELSVRGRRLRFTRSPAWARPKRRGVGTTKEQPRVLLEEVRCDGSLALSTRLDETGHFVRRTFGMTAEQFCQVVLLPQGRFADFLRADAEARRTLLEQLFATQRFSTAEVFLADQRRSVAREVDSAGMELSTVLARIGQVAGIQQQQVPGPDAASGSSDEGRPSEDSPAAAWAAQVLADALHAADCARTADDAAVARHRAACTAHANVSQVAAQQRRRADAMRTQSEMEAARGDTERLTQAVEQGRRATGLRPLVQAVESAHQALHEAQRAESVARTLLPADLMHMAAASLRMALAAVSTDLERLSDLEDDDQACRDLEATIARATDMHAGSLQQLAQAKTDIVSLSEAWESTRHGEQAAAEAAAQLPRADDTVGALEGQRDAARRRDSLRVDVAVLEAECRSAVEGVQAARGHWLDLRQERLDGMAAELAASLRPGCPCPVCGAVEHPLLESDEAAPAAAQVATGDSRRNLAAEEAQAQKALGAAEDHRRLTAEALAAARAGLAAALAVAGDEVLTHLTDRWEAARRHRDTLTAEAARLDSLRTQGTAIAAQLEAARARLQQASVEAAEHASSLRHFTEDLSVRSERLRRTCGEDGTVARRRARLLQRSDAVRDVLAAIEARSRADSAVEAAGTSALAAAEASGFSSVQAVETALVSESRLSEWSEKLQALDAQQAWVSAVLSDPDVVAAASVPPVDLDSAAANVASAERLRAQTSATRARAEAAVAALEHLTVELDTRLHEFTPLRQKYVRIDHLSRLVEGTAADNTLRMRLSAYVLAARLEQVAVAAGQRLTRMTGGRYSLVHCDEGGPGRGRAGLGLRVVDAWTGCERDPATLSGGETFTASLALALGLADVATAEAGGVLLDTLLVDEGFGSLDEDSLEEVLEVLDGLREGGRVVGLVSHVAELRTRIPAQVRVVKHRAGSSILQEHRATDRAVSTVAVA